MGLEMNQDKIKYLVMTRGTGNNSNLVVGNYTFRTMEVVKHYSCIKYLGTNIKQQNIMYNEVELKVYAANKDYYALEKLLKSKLLYILYRYILKLHAASFNIRVWNIPNS